MPTIVIVMGPSGAGKSTVGRALAEALNWAFIEADDLHPPGNVEKMRNGIGLSDVDRAPWLQFVRASIDEAVRAGRPAVVSCSALRHDYRATLSEGLEDVHFVYLKADAALLEQRLTERAGHFVGPALLSTQLATLEEPGPAALTLDAS